MPAPASLRAAPALPPKVLLFRGSMDASAAVDAKAGTLKGVSLMTANLQPTGYQMFVDAQTLATFAASLGAKLKAYLKHSWSDRTGEEAGMWSGFRIEGTQLRADFTALKAWIKYSAAAFETLFELAGEMPDEFGASAVFSYTLAWVRTNGEEIACSAVGWRWSDEQDDYVLTFEPSAPADAVREIPSVRVAESFSCDFVDVPAANRGLFSARAEQSPANPQVDAPGKGTSEKETKNIFAMDIKILHAKFGANPVRLAAAIALFAANDKLTIEAIEGELVKSEQTTELAQLRQADTTSKSEFGKLDAAGFKAKDGKSAVDVLLAEHASFKAKAMAHDAAEGLLKAAGFEAKEGKTATELALAAHKKKTDAVAELKAGGTGAVDTGSGGGEGGGSNKAELKGINRVKAAFAAKHGKN